MDDLRVDAIAQAPVCADLAHQMPADAYEQGTEMGFDVLPIREADGEIRRFVRTDALRAKKTWRSVDAEALPLGADHLVARDAPVFSLIERFAQHPELTALFCLGRAGVDGVVTVYDLNQPPAHLFAFGLVLICEAELASVLRSQLGDDPDHAVERAQVALKKNSRGIKRWLRARTADSDIHLAAALSFEEKLQLLPRFGLDQLASRLAVQADGLLQELVAVKDFRNALAHYDESDRLNDVDWVLASMRRSHHLVLSLTEADPEAPLAI
jgi:hypothetical protein